MDKESLKFELNLIRESLDKAEEYHSKDYSGESYLRLARDKIEVLIRDMTMGIIHPMRIRAQCYSDDLRISCDFDAVPWFNAIADEILSKDGENELELHGR